MAVIVCDFVSLSPIKVCRMSDKNDYEKVLALVGIGQLGFIFFANTESHLLLFIILFTMAFIFGKIPVAVAILSTHVLDKFRS